MKEAQEEGANWCNQGWIADAPPARRVGLYKAYAYYPIQKDFYNLIQTNEECGLKDSCGKIGLNGGKYDKNIKFGVNCYGLKPEADVNKDLTSNLVCGDIVDVDVDTSGHKLFPFSYGEGTQWSSK